VEVLPENILFYPRPPRPATSAVPQLQLPSPRTMHAAPDLYSIVTDRTLACKSFLDAMSTYGWQPKSHKRGLSAITTTPTAQLAASGSSGGAAIYKAKHARVVSSRDAPLTPALALAAPAAAGSDHARPCKGQGEQLAQATHGFARTADEAASKPGAVSPGRAAALGQRALVSQELHSTARDDTYAAFIREGALPVSVSALLSLARRLKRLNHAYARPSVCVCHFCSS
jgi:hypothetical protein